MALILVFPSLALAMSGGAGGGGMGGEADGPARPFAAGVPSLAQATERVFRVEVDFWCPGEFANFEAKVYRTEGVEILRGSPEEKTIEFKVKAGKTLDPAQVKAAAEDSGLRVRKIEVREGK
jgi:hypothetical protein